PYRLWGLLMNSQRWMRMWILGAVLCLCSFWLAAAQEGVFISLNSATTALQTGQTYDVQIMVENVTDLWAAEIEIGYDPSHLYIVGTRSGQPVQPGALLANKQLLAPRNRV